MSDDLTCGECGEPIRDDGPTEGVECGTCGGFRPLESSGYCPCGCGAWTRGVPCE